MILNFIELLTILKLFAIRNSSDGNNIKPQEIKELAKYKKLVFYTRLSEVELLILTSALRCTKINTPCRPWLLAQKGCAPLYFAVKFPNKLFYCLVMPAQPIYANDLALNCNLSLPFVA